MINFLIYKFQIFVIVIIKKIRFFDKSYKKKIYRFFFKNKKKFFDSDIKIDPEKGFLILNKNKLPNSENLINKCIKDSIFLYKNQKNSSGTKKYLRNILSVNNEDQIKNYLNFFLDNNIIQIVKNYLKTEPLLVELKLLHSPVIYDDSSSGSQLFHCDFDDDKIIKIFLNIFNVNERSGPLQCIQANKSNKIRNRLSINLGEHSNNIEKHISASEINTFTGLSGDMTFIDTSSCFHRGSIDTKEDRLILYANFVSKSSYRFPPIFKKSSFKNMINNHSPLHNFSEFVEEDKL